MAKPIKDDMEPVCRIPYWTENSRVNRVLRYISSNYSTVLELEAAAKAAGVSTTYLCVLFRKTLAQSFTSYSLAFRLNKAAFLLKNTEETIRGIAEACGFCSVSYFIRMFRAATKKTPQKYREALKLGLAENQSTV